MSNVGAAWICWLYKPWSTAVLQGALDEVDLDIYDLVASSGPLTLSELARRLGSSKSMVHRRVRGMEAAGVLRVYEEGGVTIVGLPEGGPRRPVEVGIVRASEYPYVIPLTKALRDRYGAVRVKVYDDALQLALDLAAGKVQLAFAPSVTLALVNRLTGGRVHIIGGGSKGGASIISGGRGEGHATSRLSSMEYCAESAGLEGPRVYARGGDEIVRSVETGRTRYGVVWEPYATIARLRGLKVEPCELETCCLLGANSSIEAEYERISRIAAEAISRARSVDPDAYANLIGMDPQLVKASLGSYSFLEEPDLGVLGRMLPGLRSAAIPDVALRELVRV